MPLPKPRDDESQDDFISRCMSELAGEFEDEDQRAAVCHQQWRDKEKAMDEETAGCVFERKSYPTEVKLVNSDEGIWECYASTFKDTPDPYGDVVDRGAFKKTIKDNFKRIRNLWNHNVNEPIGKPLHMEEDSKGLFCRNKLSLGVQRAREVRELMADGVINETSIGFDTITDRVKDKVRHLVEVRLWDISPVTFAANEEAQILSVKMNDLLRLQDIDPGKLTAAIAALRALLPEAKEAGPSTSEAEATEAAELEQAMAELEGIAIGFDAREAEARINEILANL